LIDTAGIRRKAKIGRRAAPKITSPKEIEEESIKRTLDQIKKADLVLLVIAASEPITRQDKKLAQLIHQENKKHLIVANKVDLLTNSQRKKLNELKRYFQNSLPKMKNTPLIFVSAKTKKNLNQLIKSIFLSLD
jgi:GTP-binding protein